MPERSRFPLCFPILIAALVLPAAARSEQPEDARPVIPTEHVVVTASRIETPDDKVASSVTVITGEELRRRQQPLLVDALRTVPGLDVRRSGGPGSNTSIFIRGSDADHTLVLLDGVELNDPSTPSRLPFLDHLSVEQIDRVEIVRGPQSTLYGSDAIGGVIQIFTRRGEGGPSGAAGIQGGAFGTFGADARLSGSRGRFEYAAGGSWLDSDNFSATTAGTEDDPYRNSNLDARLGWQGEGAFGLQVTARRIRAESDFDGFLSETGNRIEARQSVIQALPQVRLNDGRWLQRFRLSEARTERDTRGDFPSVVQGRVRTAGWESQVTLSGTHTLVAGLEGQWEDAELTGFESDARTTAAYVQDQILAGERFFGTVGARLDDHSAFGSKATYRATGGTRLPGSGTVIRGSLGTGFKAPSLSDLDPLSFGGNPELQPETSRGADLGVRQEWKEGRLAAEATLFASDTDDLIVAVFDSGSGSFLNFNVDRARARGVEAGLDARPGGGWLLRAAYTFTDSESRGQPQGFGLEEGGQLLRRPRHKGALEVAWGPATSRWQATLTGQYVGTRPDIDPITFSRVDADAYWLVNLAGSFRCSDRLDLLGRIDNLLDEDYEEIPGFATAGFSAYGGLRLRY